MNIGKHTIHYQGSVITRVIHYDDFTGMYSMSVPKNRKDRVHLTKNSDGTFREWTRHDAMNGLRSSSGIKSNGNFANNWKLVGVNFSKR